jgi:hypothetical protein
MRKDLLDFAETCSFYNKSQATMFRWLKSGLVPPPAVKDAHGKHYWDKGQLKAASKRISFYVPDHNSKELSDTELENVVKKIEFFTPKMSKEVITDMHHNTMSVSVPTIDMEQTKQDNALFNRPFKLTTIEEEAKMDITHKQTIRDGELDALMRKWKQEDENKGVK